MARRTCQHTTAKNIAPIIVSRCLFMTSSTPRNSKAPPLPHRARSLCLFALFKVRIRSVPHFECRIRPEAKYAKSRRLRRATSSERSFHLRRAALHLFFSLSLDPSFRSRFRHRYHNAITLVWVPHRKNGLAGGERQK